jgi:hypothetical protein
VEGNKVAIQVACPAGDVLVGGGFRPKPVEVVALVSAPMETGTGWEYSAENQSTEEVKAGELTVYALCGP